MSTLRRSVAEALAQVFLSGTWHRRTLMARGDDALGAGGPWLAELTFRIVQRFPEPPVDDASGLADVIEADHDFARAWSRRWIPHALPHFVPVAPRMGPRRWDVPSLATSGDLAAWLEVDVQHLAWFADRKGLERDAPDEALRHYRRRWIARDERLPRLLEAPRPRLKALQRRVLSQILTKIPAHEAAHGFVPGRSALTHAALHAGRRLVVRFDLETFFTSVAPARGLAVFRAAGYPSEVAKTLLGLCTTRTPERDLRAAPIPEPFTAEVSGRRFALLRRLADWHLPQGAPTSPALANLAAFGLDVRLHALARSLGLTYSRYADDLTFSTAEARSAGALAAVVETIVRDEGFRLNRDKTRVMHAHQQQRVTGIVVNARPNLARAEYDALKAVVHRCRTRGLPPEAEADSLAFRASLAGRIAWARRLSPSRGAKLQREFDQIAWPP